MPAPSPLQRKGRFHLKLPETAKRGEEPWIDGLYGSLAAGPTRQRACWKKLLGLRVHAHPCPQTYCIWRRREAVGKTDTTIFLPGKPLRKSGLNMMLCQLHLSAARPMVRPTTMLIPTYVLPILAARFLHLSR